MPTNPPPFNPGEIVGDGGGGSSGGGSSGGGSSGSSGGSSSGGSSSGGQSQIQALKDSFRNVLKELGINPGPFTDLINQAAQQEWGRGDFNWALARHKAFREMFPGIGSLVRGLGKEGSMSVSQAVAFWTQMRDSYREVARNLGLGMGKLKPKNIGLLIRNDVSPEEFDQRLRIFEQVKRTESTRQAMNQILGKSGQKQLDKRGWFRFIMGKADRGLYDLYEAAQLRSFGASVEMAKQISRGLGTPGGLTDLSQLPASLDAMKQVAGQEIRAAGLTDDDIVLAAVRDQLSGKARARADKAAQAIEQIITNRQARTQTRQTQLPPETAAGRPLLRGQAPLESA